MKTHGAMPVCDTNTHENAARPRGLGPKTARFVSKRTSATLRLRWAQRCLTVAVALIGLASANPRAVPSDLTIRVFRALVARAHVHQGMPQAETAQRMAQVTREEDLAVLEPFTARAEREALTQYELQDCDAARAVEIFRRLRAEASAVAANLRDLRHILTNQDYVAITRMMEVGAVLVRAFGSEVEGCDEARMAVEAARNAFFARIIPASLPLPPAPAGQGRV